MVTIEVDNVHSRVVCDEALFLNLRKLLSFAAPGSEFVMRAYPRWGWDGRTYLMKKDGTFPTGLLPRVLRFLKIKNIECEVSSQTIAPERRYKFRVNESEWKARDYQQEAVTAARERPRGVFDMSVGAGKTLTAALIIADKGVDTLFVTPDLGLKEQAFTDFTIGSARKPPFFLDARQFSTDVKSDAPVVICNIQSLFRQQPRFFQRFGMLITDEFHHSAAKSYLGINKMLMRAYYRYGMTGTMFRADGADMTMHGVLSETIYRKTPSDLIEAGWLVKPHITIVRYQLEGWSRLSYKAAYDRIIMDTGLNTVVSRIANEKISEGKQTLILVRRKDHGELLNQMIGGHSVYLSGDDPVENRERYKRLFIEKKIPCIIATNILGEGQDIPSIDVLVNARFQKSDIQTVQGIGRALRKFEGKDKAEVFDFLVMGHRSLQAHSVERINAYRKERAFEISVVRSEMP